MAPTMSKTSEGGTMVAERDDVAVPDVNQASQMSEAAEEEEVSWEPIDTLTNLGVQSIDIKKLKDAGIFTVQGLQMQTRKTLIGIKGISEAKVDKLLDASEKINPSNSFITGTEVLTKRKQVTKITTACKDLDTLLGGGIESMSITEVFGEFRTGKTQLAHTLAVTAQLPTEYGGGNGKVAYIDTEGTFRPERIPPIAARYGVDADSVLDNIIYARAYTSDQQMSLLTEVAAKMSEEPFSLLIVDSITALYRVDFSGRGELADRQQKLGKFLSRLNKIAEEYNIAVYVTNQVTADPGAGAMFVADAKKPIGGHVVAHACTTRLMLRKGRGEQRICKVYDSPCLPESEAIFQIGTEGICDVKD